MNARGKTAAAVPPKAAGGSAGKRRSSSISKSRNNDELPEQPILIWPEWVDSEVLSEKWNTKHVFEDPDGLVILPRSLRPCADGFKRLVELSEAVPIGMSAPGLAEAYFQGQQQHQPVAGSISKSGTVSSFPMKSAVESALAEVSEDGLPEEEEPSILNIEQPSQEEIPEASHIDDGDQSVEMNNEDPTRANIQATPLAESSVNPVSELDAPIESDLGDIVISSSNLFKTNNHLIGSEFIRSVLIALHIIYEQADQAKATKQGNNVEEMYPWEFIYPKSKDGLPQYNASGKYMVKLFWLGAWRKITVDDRIPVDGDGKPLLVVSPLLHEIWPLILCKALMKIASASYREDGFCELGDFDVLSALRGWVPERLAINPHKQNTSIWDTMTSLGLKNGIRGSVAGLNNGPSSASTPKPAAKQSIRTSVVAESNKATIINVLAMRDGEDNQEKPDLNTLPFAFRVTEIREVASYNSSKAPGVEGENQRQVRIKHYFSCGYGF
jgi:hypothetical protein